MSSSAVVRMKWPTSPRPPPPIARRSTPAAAICSARSAIWPGLLGTWTTNCLGIGASGRHRPRGGIGMVGVILACAGRSGLSLRVGSRWPAGRPRGTSARSPCPSGSRRPCRDRRSAAHARGLRAKGGRPPDGLDERRRRRVVEHEPGPRPRPLVRVDDRVREPAGPAHDRRRPVAQGDHLALPAGLEPRRHEEHVRARVDPAGHVAVEALDERDPARVRGGQRPERVRERRVAAPLDDDPRARGQELRGAVGEEVEALLRVHPPDHPEHDRRRRPDRSRCARGGPRGRRPCPPCPRASTARRAPGRRPGSRRPGRCR